MITIEGLVNIALGLVSGVFFVLVILVLLLADFDDKS